MGSKSALILYYHAINRVLTMELVAGMPIDAAATLSQGVRDHVCCSEGPLACLLTHHCPDWVVGPAAVPQ